MNADLPASLDRSLAPLLELIHERTGLVYQNGKVDILMDKLASLLAERGLQSWVDYYYLLKYDPQREAEWHRLESVLAVNETYFWREFDQIRAVVDVVLPALVEAHPERPIRIWHAACATGEEPYSMAMALEEKGWFSRASIEIVGTDFNSESLARARTGIYRARSFRALPDDLLRRYFVPAGGEESRLVDALRSKVSFHYLNLMDQDAIAGMGTFPLIFCRNAFIYFSPGAIQKVVEAFYRALQPPGYLFVAAAESLLQITDAYQLVEIEDTFAYQKVAGLSFSQER